MTAVTDQENPNITRLAQDQEPDLLRDAGAGYQVECFYVPDFLTPERAVVQVIAAKGKIILDSIDVPFKEGFDVWKHTAVHSDKYAEALT